MENHSRLGNPYALCSAGSWSLALLGFGSLEFFIFSDYFDKSAVLNALAALPAHTFLGVHPGPSHFVALSIGISV